RLLAPLLLPLWRCEGRVSMFSNLLEAAIMSSTSLARRSQVHRSSRRKTLARILRIESLEARQVLSTTYLVHDLVSDQPGVAPLTDPHLVNGWGIAVNPSA